jgi:hypothetical protein
MYICNPSIREAEAEGSQVQDQPGLHSENLPQKKRVRERNSDIYYKMDELK